MPKNNPFMYNTPFDASSGLKGKPKPKSAKPKKKKATKKGKK